MARARTLAGRINGSTGAYMGNNRRHSLTPGNRLASHNKVYRQLRRTFGMSAG